MSGPVQAFSNNMRSFQFLAVQPVADSFGNVFDMLPVPVENFTENPFPVRGAQPSMPLIKTHFTKTSHAISWYVFKPQQNPWENWPLTTKRLDPLFCRAASSSPFSPHQKRFKRKAPPPHEPSDG
jgi:hypothetical protein